MQVVIDEPTTTPFTMHGTIMLLLFATPLFFGFGNVIMPLQIGSPDAVPASEHVQLLALPVRRHHRRIRLPHPAGRGRLRLVRLHAAVRRGPLAGRRWRPVDHGPVARRFGTILGAVNFITTIICMRAPGMTMFRMPIFVWNTLVTSLLVLIAFPVLAGALLSLEADRRARRPRLRRGPRRRDPVAAPVLVLRHPEVYIIALPFFGIVTEILPVQPQADLRLRRPSAPRSGSRSCRWPCGPTTCSSPAPSTCRSSPA